MGNTPCNALGVRHTTHVFLIWHVLACEIVISRLSPPGLVHNLYQPLKNFTDVQIVTKFNKLSFSFLVRCLVYLFSFCILQASFKWKYF